MALTKSDIVNELASIGKGTIFSRRQSTDLVESLLEIIKQRVERMSLSVGLANSVLERRKNAQEVIRK